MKLPKFEKVKSMAALAGRFFCYDVNIYDEKMNHARVLLLLIGCDLVVVLQVFLQPLCVLFSCTWGLASACVHAYIHK